jgi:hypothetical protein
MNCTQTAAHLTERYHTFQPFDPEELSLNRYLSRNGLLLSMCLNIQSWRPCAPTGDQNHLAASWIQSQETGYRVIHAPQLPDTTFGIILDPAVTEINCLYPVDAGSDGRVLKSRPSLLTLRRITVSQLPSKLLFLLWGLNLFSNVFFTRLTSLISTAHSRQHLLLFQLIIFELCLLHRT